MFNEKTQENYVGKDIPVFQLPKYKQARAKAEELINGDKYGLTEADFWILMNTNKKKDKMMYTNLIISHNGCLKINDELENKFKPSCVSIDKDGYKKSLVYTYNCEEQGIYEVGEVSESNCRNDYPYAMAYKRLFDRVVLKLSKLAYSGIMSDSESEEFTSSLEASGHIEKEPQKEEKPLAFLEEEPMSDLTKEKLRAMIRSYRTAFNVTSAETISLIEDKIGKKKDDFTDDDGQLASAILAQKLNEVNQ